MYHIRVSSPPVGTERILAILAESDGVSNVTVIAGSARYPEGDVVECDLLPDMANDIIHRLREIGPRQRGAISVDRRETAVIRTHREMIKPIVNDREVAPVWEVVDATIRVNATYPVSFYLLLLSAGLLAAVGILTNSQILIVAAMVVGPEYNAILGAALGITERNRRPVRRGLVALLVGFAMAIVATFVFSEIIRNTAGAPRDYQLGFRPVADLINQPNLYSVIVAFIAGIVGVVSIAQARASALIGVFISVTTIPAAASIGVSTAFSNWSEALGATEQLLVNVVVLLVVGVVVLVVQRRYWHRRELRTRALTDPEGAARWASQHGSDHAGA